MKILKKILIAIVGLVVLILIIAIFTKKEYTVERQITINKPTNEVFDYIKILKNSNNYSVWNQMDPNMKREYTGTDGTVGFIYAWDSQEKNVGKGEQEIAKIEEGNRIDYAIRFYRPWEGNGTSYMITEPAGDNQTSTKWAFQGKMGWPMNAMLLFMDMDKMMGPDLEKGLATLKTILESPKQ